MESLIKLVDVTMKAHNYTLVDFARRLGSMHSLLLYKAIDEGDHTKIMFGTPNKERGNHIIHHNSINEDLAHMVDQLKGSPLNSPLASMLSMAGIHIKYSDARKLKADVVPIREAGNKYSINSVYFHVGKGSKLIEQNLGKFISMIKYKMTDPEIYIALDSVFQIPYEYRVRHKNIDGDNIKKEDLIFKERKRRHIPLKDAEYIMEINCDKVTAIKEIKDGSIRYLPEDERFQVAIKLKRSGLIESNIGINKLTQEEMREYERRERVRAH